ncbi:YceI family protein [Catenovulum agarivorans]|uniref:YceI family protein n=1 Tax=Catenovulum agarivorans TaxID=1172192 RepID=UPI0002DDD626|nr:YceI family protein [Catenovulum agarivorans]
MKLRALLATATLGLAFANSAFAGWKLDEQASKLNFLSTKKAQIVEQHSFKNISGTVADSGQVVLTIELASVETNIPIRNERMQKFLFETDKFAHATINAKVDSSVLTALAVGELKTLELAAELDLHGNKQNLTVPVVVIKGNKGQLFVNSVGSVVINAADFALIEGVNKLQELAGLPSITYSVPVSFNLTFAVE